MRKVWFLLPLLLLACTPPGPSLSLSPSRALVGEEVEARLRGMTGFEARVFVGGVEAEVTLRAEERVRFRVPAVPGGPKPVRVVAGNREARGELGVLGTVDRNRILLRLPMGRDPKLLAHRRGRTGQGVKVGVLDTGVDATIPQLPGYDFVEEDAIPQDAFPGGHGTGVAGLVKEVAPDAGILPVRVCDENGDCRASRVVRGVCWVVANRQGPTVLNLSLGGDTPVEALKLALQAALSQGIPVAAAAGNQGDQGSPAHYPAALDLPGLVAVGALEAAPGTLPGWQPAPYSTQGTYVDISAPGTDLNCPLPGGGTGSCTGTSFATPLVAGAMALWLQADPSLTPAQVQQRLAQYAKPLPYPRQAVGAGVLDLSQRP